MRYIIDILYKTEVNYMKTNRVNNVLKEMSKQGLNQMIVSSPPAIFYLTGKWFSPGERMVALYLNTAITFCLIQK